jgi:hypothetical protein
MYTAILQYIFFEFYLYVVFCMISVINQSQYQNNYLKVVTGGNDPSISRSQQYAQVARNTHRYKKYPIVTYTPPFFKDFLIDSGKVSTFDLTDYLISDFDGTTTFYSSNSKILSINGNIATVNRENGQVIVTVTQTNGINTVGRNSQALVTITSFVVKYVTTLKLNDTICSFGDTPFRLHAISNSPAPIIYDTDDHNVAVFTADNVLIPVNIGVTRIIAYQNATGGKDSTYTAASVTVSLTVNAIQPAVRNFYILKDYDSYGFADVNGFNRSFSITGGVNFISNSTGAFIYESYDTNVATVDAVTGWVTTYSNGQTIIYVTQLAAGNYTEFRFSCYLNVYPMIHPIITFNNIVIDLANTPAIDLTDYISTDSDGKFTFRLTDTSPCIDLSINQNIATFHGAGEYYINAALPETHAYYSGFYAANSTATVIATSLVADFNTNLVLNDFACNYKDASFTIDAVSDSPSLIIFSSDNTHVATVEGNRIIPHNAGTAQITAMQPAFSETDFYYSAVSKTVTFTVNPIQPTVDNFDVLKDRDSYGITDVNGVYRRFHITDQTEFNSDSTGEFIYDSYDTNVATIDAATGWVTTVGEGKTIITVTQLAVENYTEFRFSCYLNVYPLIHPRITFNNFIIDLTNMPTIDLTDYIYTDSDGKFTFRLTDTSPSVDLSINENIATFHGAGEYYINAALPETHAYYVANSTATAISTSLVADFNTNLVLNDFECHYNDAPFEIPATSDSQSTITFVSSNTSVATVDGNRITPRNAGTAQITATQIVFNSQNVSYSAVSTTATFTVKPIQPAVRNFDVLKDRVSYGITDVNGVYRRFHITDQTEFNSNSPGAFTYESYDTNVATIDQDGWVTTVGEGTTIITVTQLAAGNYTEFRFSCYLNVYPLIHPRITFNNFMVNLYNTPTIHLTEYVSTDSDGQFTFSLASASPSSNVTIRGNVATFHGVGEFYINAALPETHAYYTGNFTAICIVTTLAVEFRTHLLFDDFQCRYRDAPFAIHAESDSPAPVMFSVSQPAGQPVVATITGNIITPVNAGVVAIVATQDAWSEGDQSYSATSATVHFTVNKIQPIIQNIQILRDYDSYGITDVNGVNRRFHITGQVDFISDSPGGFTYDSYDKGVAVVDAEGWVTTVGQGTTIIYVTQLAAANYEKYTFYCYVNVYPLIHPTITFQPFAVNIANTHSVNLLNYATTNSDAALQFSSTDPNIAIDGDIASFSGIGQIPITASLPETTHYYSTTYAVDVVVTSIQAKFNTVIEFSPVQCFYRDAPFQLHASSNSPSPITFVSSDPTIAAVVDNVITPLKIGQVTVTASQAAYNTDDVSYPAATAEAVFTIHPIQPTISNIDILRDADIFGYGFTENITGGATFQSNSAGQITYDSYDETVATVDSLGVVTSIKKGTTLIRVTQAAAGNYTSFMFHSYVNVIELTPAVIRFDDFVFNSESSDVIDLSQYVVTNSDAPVVFTSSDPTQLSIAGNIATIMRGFLGAVNVTASQVKTHSFYAGSKTAVVFITGIHKKFETNLVFGDDAISCFYGDAAFRLAATSDSPAPVVYTSADSSIAAMVGDLITPMKAGVTTITASQPAYINAEVFYSEASKNATFTVKPIPPTISNLGILQNKDIYGIGVRFHITDGVRFISGSDGEFTYNSYDKSVATIDVNTGWVTTVGAGSTIVYVTQEASGNYSAFTFHSYLNVY